MKTKFNTLHKYIFHISDREYAKETINSLFSSVLAPILSFQETQGCILLKLQNPDENKSLLTRLKFSQCKIYAFCDELKNFGIENIQIENIWKSTQFVVILTQRYSSALIWDYSISEKPDYAKACLLFNSKIISEITRVILDNSSFDYKQIASMYSAERRENRLLNIATENIADVLNNKNEEIIFNAVEKKIMENFDDKIEVAQIVADKAKFISHEIKNCLSVINLYSTILEKRLSKISLDNDTLDSVNNSLKNIKNSSENISSLISDLRCLSSPYIISINIKDLIDDTVLLCKEKASKSGVNISSEDILNVDLMSDKIKIQCALINVIYNAIEACHKGSKIEIYTKKEDDFYNIYIKNDGAKIPEQYYNKIFESEFTTKSTGNGLGLAICKKQLEMIQGDIQLVSSDDNFTLFKIQLKSN